MVERAIRECASHVRAAVDGAKTKGARASERELRQAMARSVSAAVANYDGEPYADYPDKGGCLMFGTQAIRISDFVDAICDICEIRKIC